MFMPTITFLEGIGAPIERHLNQARIPLLALDNPETLVSLPMAITFLSRAAYAEGIENLDWGNTAPAMGFSESLEQTLSTLLLSGYPTIECTAEAIGWSVRTL
jgi:hypothetical protein